MKEKNPLSTVPYAITTRGYFARKELAPWYLQDTMQKNKQAK